MLPTRTMNITQKQTHILLRDIGGPYRSFQATGGLSIACWRLISAMTCTGRYLHCQHAVLLYSATVRVETPNLISREQLQHFHFTVPLS